METAQEFRDRGREGIALITTLLVVLAVGAMVTGAMVLGSNHLVVEKYWSRQSNLVGLADAGVEEGRALLNGNASLFPDSGYVAIESGAPVRDGRGNTIPGVQRWTYTGPTGIVSGEYGIFGSVVSVVRDDGGGVAIRRKQVYQESFAKFAYFTDNEGGNIYFASGDHIWGPLHTNDQIKIHSSGANFHDEVTTAEDVYNPQHGTFSKGYEEFSPVIPMPETTDLLRLHTQAQAGGTAFTSTTNGDEGESTTRIEFVAVDLNDDGDRVDEGEGFFRVYQSSDYEWVSAKAPWVEEWYFSRGRWRSRWVQSLGGSEQCGDYHGTTFVAAADHPLDGHDASAALQSNSRVCYLGGDDRIRGEFVPDDGKGEWLRWGGEVDETLASLRDDAAYLFPINRSLNAEFKGVIYVEGKVMLSGEIRGRVTVAATDNIILGDDLTYATDPGAGSCADIAGYFAGGKFVLSNNLLNAPARAPGSTSYSTFDESTGEFIHGVVLALENFTAEEYTQGSTSAEFCESSRAGRGCIYLTGGIIQDTRGPVGLTDGHGYVKRYSYDRCAQTQPPPYFPTTGVFREGQYYQVDPAGFNVAEYFRLLAPGG